LSILDEWNHTAIERLQNGDINVYVNGVLHMTVNDNEYTEEGYVMIQHHYDGYIDNLRVH